MKKVGPQVAVLREQYGDDKQGMQQALIELYQREKVNPVSGCFPIILQIPILFALYKTFFVTIEIRHAPFFGWIDDLSAPDPTSIFNLFGLIPWDPPTVLQIGIWPCLMLVGMIIQKKLNPPPTDQIQKDLANYMPFFFVYIMAQFAAGLVIYWTFSAFIGIAQQIFIMKSMNVPIHLFGETEKEDEFLDTKMLAKVAEKDAEDALFDDEEDGVVPPPKNIKPPKPKKKSPAAKKKKK
jgi:YidC/Oxa1 family membrane protein insertase